MRYIMSKGPAPWLFALLLLAACGGAAAAPVGLKRQEAPMASAADRRSDHRPTIAVTIWYPAADGATTAQIDIGPPGRALLVGGQFAVDAAPRAGAYPVILLSHGFGGSAEDLSWLAGGLAAHGFVVIGVDHPGNNAMDRTLVGGTAWWERPRDLIAVARAMAADPVLGPHLDMNRVGAAGFSMGGMTALALGGARIDPGHFDDFCATGPRDEVCGAAPETPDAPRVTQREGVRLLGLDAAAARAGENTAFPGLRAILAIAPPVQMLAPDSLGRIAVPTVLVIGDRDPLVPAATQADVAARAIKGARLVIAPGVAHYSFVGTCTAYGRQILDLCAKAPNQDRAHALALKEALRLFGKTLARGR